MARKTIFSVGMEWPVDDVTEFSFSKNISLLDADIVVFTPCISTNGGSYDVETYLGKLCYGDSSSFQLKESIDHWRREIKDAYDAGKTVFIFLDELLEVYVATGENKYSGTGRNRQTTRIVTLINNYKALPIDLGPVNTTGSAMKLTKEGSVISGYWKDFGNLSKYKVLLKQDTKAPIVVTKSGDKPVGSIIRGKSGGNLVLLPYFSFDGEEYTVESKESETGLEWTETAVKAGKRLVAHLVEIDKCLRENFNRTPVPDWAKDRAFISSKEKELHGQLLILETQIEKLAVKKETVITNLNESGYLRGLLYENGPALESAIIDGLKILGFSANNFKNDQSEFDVVFESDEGRLLGEAEGKDSKPISIEKLRQLEMNIHEDFSRDEVTSPAKGVLFGNAYRLLDLPQRADYFTEKCMTAAQRSGYALIRTPDLFFAVKHVIDTGDQNFARDCRLSIVNTAGDVVIFPIISSSGCEGVQEVAESANKS